MGNTLGTKLSEIGNFVRHCGAKSVNALLIVLLLAVLLLSGELQAKQISLTLPSFRDGSHQYYVTLLSEVLKSAGHKPVITLVPEMPQSRVTHELKRNKISLYWLLKTEKRDQQFSSIDVGLTGGLIGQRILFIPKNRQQQFEGIENLADFRALDKVGGFGSNWYDIDVWQENKLKYQTVSGDWHKIYKMLQLENRGIDYFSRGAIEILAESKMYPYLQVEKNLLLQYDRDFVFYLSPNYAKYKQIINQAFALAKRSGLLHILQTNHWQNDIVKLNLNNRLVIKLNNPGL